MRNQPTKSKDAALARDRSFPRILLRSKKKNLTKLLTIVSQLTFARREPFRPLSSTRRQSSLNNNKASAKGMMLYAMRRKRVRERERARAWNWERGSEREHNIRTRTTISKHFWNENVRGDTRMLGTELNSEEKISRSWMFHNIGSVRRVSFRRCFGLRGVFFFVEGCFWSSEKKWDFRGGLGDRWPKFDRFFGREMSLKRRIS